MLTVNVLLVVAAAAVVKAQGMGPGKGPWEKADPASVGLSTQMLAEAAKEIKDKARNRKCFIAIKEGKIVHEEYYGGSSESSTNTGYSTTKSLCSSLFGISVQQGWGNVNDPVTYSRDSLKCNRRATMKNVLTMTGQSVNLPDEPTFKYDALGIDCLDTIQGYILMNNPDGLATDVWMNKYFWAEMGFEHSQWRKSIYLQCGTSSQMSCRDLARHAQLWLNYGYQPGVGQLLNRQYIEDGTKWVFPNAGGDAYGYAVRRRKSDPVDPNVVYFGGVQLQCAFFSYEHNAIVISMGTDLLSSCEGEVWEDARYAIVSRDHPLWQNATDLWKQTLARRHAMKNATVLQQ